jgi:Methyltransferase domain
MNAVDVFCSSLQDALMDGTLHKLTLGKLRDELADQEHIYVRPVEVRGELQLSFVHRYPDHDTTKNFSRTDGLARIRAWLGTASLAATLFTTAERMQLLFNRRGKPRLHRQRETTEEPPSRQHDQSKARLLQDERFLTRLGVLDPSGRPKIQMGDKYRQVHHFIELVEPLTREMRAAERIKAVDLGCGKGYLTFALYAFLTEKGLQAEVTGIEQRRPLVDLGNEIAKSCGYGGLRFEAARIDETELAGADLVVALHACDTATDDALLGAIRAGARWILAAPCCHKEVRPQIRPPEGLEPLFRFGIQVDRLAESVTDTLRVLCLESAGYEARIQEFISLEHTSKNLLILASKRLKAADQLQKWRETVAFQTRFGIRHQRLVNGLAPEHE